MTHFHARAAQLYIFQQTKPFYIPIDKATTDKERRCSSSQKRRVLLGQNFIVSVVVLIKSLSTRFSSFRWDRQLVAMVSQAGLYFWLGHQHTSLTCSAGQVNKKKHPAPTTLYHSGWWGDPLISPHLQRRREACPPMSGLSSHLLTASAHQIAHCS